MKKFAFTIIAILAIAVQGYSQEIAKNAIGVRLGDSDGFGPEVNYQRAVGENNRLEFGLALHSRRHYDAIKLTGIYQWVWNIDGGFNWYAGPGAGFGIVNYDDKYYDRYDDRYDDRRNSDTFGFLTGDVGIEYSFDFPLLLSIDLRPQVNFGHVDDVNLDFGIAARYQF